MSAQHSSGVRKQATDLQGRLDRLALYRSMLATLAGPRANTDEGITKEDCESQTSSGSETRVGRDEKPGG